MAFLAFKIKQDKITEILKRIVIKFSEKQVSPKLYKEKRLQ